MHKLSPFLAALACTAFCGAARADITYNTSLASPPGVYFANTDNTSNSGFTVYSGNNHVEIGLSAINRFVGPITPTGNVYDVGLGNTTDGNSVWGVTFSINLQADGVAGLTLADVTTGLTLHDVVNGTTTAVPFDLKLIGDNGEAGTNGTCNDLTKVGQAKCPAAPTNPYALQNSETLSFASVSAALGDPAFDDTLNDTYFFTLAVTTNRGVLLGTDTIEVVAGTGAPAGVPEPITLSIFGAGLAGAAALRRRRQRSKA